MCLPGKTPSAPSVTGLAETAITQPTTTAADEADEPGMLTDDDEVIDDLVYSTGVKHSLVQPLAFVPPCLLTAPAI